MESPRIICYGRLKLFVVSVVFTIVILQLCSAADSRDAKELRISAKKCQEYKEFYRENFAPRVPGREPILGKHKCPSNRRVNPSVRREVFKHEYPHTASLWYDDIDSDGKQVGYKFRCSGSLISKHYVLVSGHCIYSKWGKPTHVTFGDSHLYEGAKDSKRQVIEIEEIIPHPNYVPPSHVDDIALIKLSKGVKYDVKTKNPRPSVRPACLPVESQEIPNGVAALTTFDPTDGALRTERLSVYPSIKDCEPILKQTQNFSVKFGDVMRPTQLCTKGLPSSSCVSDMGATLTVQMNRQMSCMDTIIGVLAVNASSCSYDDNQPITFTKVEMYLDWIEEKIWPRYYRRSGLGSLRTSAESDLTLANVTSSEADV